MTCYCYIVECADGTFYTGWTTDPARRVKAHNAGRGARYTRMRRPVRLVYVEEQPDRSSAMKRERAIKALPREKKMKLIACRSDGLSRLAGVVTTEVDYPLKPQKQLREASLLS